ncbi:MAG: hypothetical protein J1F11_02755 [Oscillospiraceae bacterium]|nr:hypothetical protein [Oscillospiraceae bacterium]
MKTTSFLLTAALAAALTFSGCSETPADNSAPDVSASKSSGTEVTASEINETTESEWTELILEFPSGKDEMTDYNKDILSVDPFTASLMLPSGWDVKDDCPAGAKFLNLGAFSTRYIYDENNNCVGAVGYNVIPELSEDEFKIPAAVYNQIALGNGYQFNVRERYETVQSSDTCEAALTDVYYSNTFNDSNGEKLNKGIIMQDTSAGVYIAAEFESDSLTDAQHKEIAEALKITLSKAEPEAETESVSES